MKILYSKIKELVPNLKASPEEVGEVFTMTGLMMDSFTEVKYQGKKDYILGLEVRQNRPDCLSIIGLAYEIATYYGSEVQLPSVENIPEVEEELDIKVGADKHVKRILAVQLGNMKNTESPDWLKSFLELYEINSINLLVDLSNYVMLLTGYTSHLLDVSKIKGQLSWEINKKKIEIQTLDERDYKLIGKELVIRDDDEILALAGIIGCNTASIDLRSDVIIAEMAIYDSTIIQQNSRSLSVVTEASNRLSKDMDPGGADYAFNLLINLLIQHGKGKVVSKVFNHYPEPRQISSIEFDPELASKFAGIDISKERVREILENLRFTVEDYGEKYKITAPADRMDIECKEDLVEEVIRMNRFDIIPIEEVPRLEITKDITPLIYKLEEAIRDNLVVQGYDEILSQPLVGVDINQKTNYLSWKEILTINSVNEEYPALRQSIATGLLVQAEEYLKKNVSYINIFEIGKIFGWMGAKYEEKNALGMLSLDSDNINIFKNNVERVLRSLGAVDLRYSDAKHKPAMANPHSCWNILLNGKIIGILSKLKPINKKTGYYAEIDLTELISLLDYKVNSTIEITKKIVVLDANVKMEHDKLGEYLQGIRNKIGEENIWSIEVADKYQGEKNNTKYTIRVSYKELSDQEAKEIHSKVFNL
ncbi:MAG: phenylalanine--tRNA ligase beta subunit-related protein [bacterium]